MRKDISTRFVSLLFATAALIAIAGIFSLMTSEAEPEVYRMVDATRFVVLTLAGLLFILVAAHEVSLRRRGSKR